MAQFKINGDDAFQVLSHSFSVGKASNSYTLKYSASGRDDDWTSYDEEIPAGETLIVVDCAFGQYIKLDGNTDEVDIIY